MRLEKGLVNSNILWGLMMNKIFGILAIGAFFITGCASVPMPLPDDGKSAGIAVSVRTQPPLHFGAEGRPDAVYFVKLDESQDNQFISREIYRSNYVGSGYQYALNIPPGKYALVVSDLSGKGRCFRTYFSENLARQTQIEAVSGQLKFIGEVVVKQRGDWNNHDSVQRYFSKSILIDESIKRVRDKKNLDNIEEEKELTGFNKFISVLLKSGGSPCRSRSAYKYLGRVISFNNSEEANDKFVNQSDHKGWSLQY